MFFFLYFEITHLTLRDEFIQESYFYNQPGLGEFFLREKGEKCEEKSINLPFRVPAPAQSPIVRISHFLVW